MDNIWRDSFPERKELAENILSVVKHTLQDKNNYNKNVVAINGKYGHGKSFFVNKLAQMFELKENNINTIKISLWEKDFSENPFLVIFEEICKLTYNKLGNKRKTKAKLKEFATVAGKIMAKTALKVVDANSGAAGSAILETLVEDLDNNKEDDVTKFQKQLEKIAKELNGLVIIIDELDRCRPDYAIKALEIIKHLFNIDNIVFILPINRGVLESTINKFYGFDENTFKDQEHYLDRFYDISFDLSVINYSKFIALELEKLKLDQAKIDNYSGIIQKLKDGHYLINELCSGTKSLNGTATQNPPLSYRELNKVIQRIQICVNQLDYIENIDILICMVMNHYLKGETIIGDGLRSRILVSYEHNNTYITRTEFKNLTYELEEILEKYNKVLSFFKYHSKN